MSKLRDAIGFEGCKTMICYGAVEDELEKYSCFDEGRSKYRTVSSKKQSKSKRRCEVLLSSFQNLQSIYSSQFEQYLSPAKNITVRKNLNQIQI